MKNQIGTALTFMSIVALCTDALMATPSAIHHPHQQLIHSRSLTTLGNAQLDDDSSSFEDVFADEASAAILSGQDLDIITLRGGDALKSFSPQSIVSSFKLGLSQRVAADPNFLLKSILEVVLAATTQYMAEVSRRGWNRMLPEIDFVFAGVLTAVIGKYYSCWRVAKTSVSKPKNEIVTVDNISKNNVNWRERVPTNAFQKTLLDGHTTPSMLSRFLAVVVPMPQLFRAGVIASTIGYGITSAMIQLRTMFIPSYVPQTNPVSVPLAALYTGAFMALVSNIRYQLLQGVIEPYLIDTPFFKLQRLAETNNGLVGRIARWKIWKTIKGLLILAVRWANGLLGSWLAIGGMRALNLQQLKS